MRAPLAAALAMALAFGCTEQSTTPTALNEATPAPSFIINAPPVSGPYVVRGEFRQLFSSYYTVTPDGNDWFAWSGMPLDPDDLSLCGAGASQAEFIAFQSVERPERVNDLLMGVDRRVVFWDAAQFIATWDSDGLCAAMHLTPVAVGEARIEINNDNDLYGQTGHNVWGYKVQGTTNGYNFSYHVKLQFNASQGFRVLTEVGSVH